MAAVQSKGLEKYSPSAVHKRPGQCKNLPSQIQGAARKLHAPTQAVTVVQKQPRQTAAQPCSGPYPPQAHSKAIPRQEHKRTNPVSGGASHFVRQATHSDAVWSAKVAGKLPMPAAPHNRCGN